MKLRNILKGTKAVNIFKEIWDHTCPLCRQNMERKNFNGLTKDDLCDQCRPFAIKKVEEVRDLIKKMELKKNEQK